MWAERVVPDQESKTGLRNRSGKTSAESSVDKDADPINDAADLKEDPFQGILRGSFLTVGHSLNVVGMIVLAVAVSPDSIVENPVLKDLHFGLGCLALLFGVAGRELGSVKQVQLTQERVSGYIEGAITSLGLLDLKMGSLFAVASWIYGVVYWYTIAKGYELFGGFHYHYWHGLFFEGIAVNPIYGLFWTYLMKQCLVSRGGGQTDNDKKRGRVDQEPSRAALIVHFALSFGGQCLVTWLTLVILRLGVLSMFWSRYAFMGLMFCAVRVGWQLEWKGGMHQAFYIILTWCFVMMTPSALAKAMTDKSLAQFLAVYFPFIVMPMDWIAITLISEAFRRDGRNPAGIASMSFLSNSWFETFRFASFVALYFDTLSSGNYGNLVINGLIGSLTEVFVHSGLQEMLFKGLARSSPSLAWLDDPWSSKVTTFYYGCHTVMEYVSPVAWVGTVLLMKALAYDSLKQYGSPAIWSKTLEKYDLRYKHCFELFAIYLCKEIITECLVVFSAQRLGHRRESTLPGMSRSNLFGIGSYVALAAFIGCAFGDMAFSG